MKYYVYDSNKGYQEFEVVEDGVSINLYTVSDVSIDSLLYNNVNSQKYEWSH